MKIHLLTLLSFLILVLFSIPAIWPLFHNGFFPMHDDTQPTRVHEMTIALRSGQFPVRWVPDLGYGYGYPIFNFYAPLPYYIGALFELVGFSAVAATKIMMGIGMILAMLTMYILAKEYSGEAGGLLAAVLYMYAPYHSVDLYVRGAVGELYAYAWLPLVILGCLSYKKYFYSGVLGLAAVFISHTLFGMITIWLLALYGGVLLILVGLKKIPYTNLVLYIAMCLFAFGLASFFLLPAFVEKQFTNVESITGGGSDFHQHFVYLDQLWDSPWGYAGSAPGRADGMSFKIGKLHIIFAVLSIYLLIFFLYLKTKSQTTIQICYGILLLTLLSIFLMTSASVGIWERLPGFAYIQYPWRFLTITVLGVSFLGSIGMSFISKKVAPIVSMVLGLAIVGYYGKYFIPSTYTSNVSMYTDTMSMRFAISKISDEYLPKNFIIPKDPSEISLVSLHSTESIRVKQRLTDRPTEKVYSIQAIQSAPLLTEIAFFPGWHASIDGKEIPIINQRGRVGVILPQGDHRLGFKFVNTPVRITGNAISLFCLFLLVYVSLFSRRLLWVKKRVLK